MNRRGFLKGLGLAAASSAIGHANDVERKAAGSIHGFSFAFFTDVHLHPQQDAPEGTSLAIDLMNRSNAEFAICGGDHIFDGLAAGRDSILEQYALYSDLEKRLNLPVWHALGNHDVAGVLNPAIGATDLIYGKALFRKTFNTPTSYTFHHKGVRFIVLDSIEIVGRSWAARVDDTQMERLKTILEAHPEMPTVVVSHIPLATGIANYYPGSNSEAFSAVANSREIIPLLERYNVLAVLQGHTHIMEDVKRHGIHYITGGAVSGNWWRGAHYGDREGVLFVTVEGGTVSTSYAPTGFVSIDPERV